MGRPIRWAMRRAILTGALVGMVLAGAPILAVIAYSAAGSEGYRDIGVTPWTAVASAMPAALVLGALIAFPTAALLVFAMTWVAKRWRVFDAALTWAAAGALLTLPLALAASGFDAPARSPDFNWLSASVLGIGALSALAAWGVGRRS